MNVFFKIKSVAKDTILYLLASLIPACISIIINPFVAKNMSPMDYAITGYISSFNTIATPLILFCFIRYYLKNYYIANEDERFSIKATIVKGLLFFSFFMSLLFILLVTIYHYYFNADSTLQLFPYIFISTLSVWLSGIISLQLADYRIQKHSKKYFLLSVTKSLLLYLSIIVLVIFLKKGALGYLFSSLIDVIIIFVYCLYINRKYLNVKFDSRPFNDIVIFCIPLVFAGLLEFFTSGFTRVFLERVGDNQEYGYYNVGFSFANYIGIFTTALFASFSPDLYKYVAQKNYRKIIQISIYVVLIQVFVVLLFILISPIAIDLLTAGRYVKSIGYARIISLSHIFIIMFYLINDITIAMGKTKMVLYTKIVSSIISVFVTMVIINKYGYIGGAIVLSINMLIYFTVNIILLYTSFKCSKIK